MSLRPRPLAVASGGAFVSALSTSLVAVSVPVIARDLGVTPHDVSWVLSAYLLTISSLLALVGQAADVLGSKRVYLTGFVFFVAGGAMCGTAADLRALVGARVIQGVGAAMLMAVGPALVTRAVAPDRRARSLGIQLATTYLGSTLGPGLGGLLAARIGWQAVFIVIAGAGAIGGVLSLFLLPPDAREESPGDGALRRLDLGGAVLLAGALVALLLGLKRAQDDGWSSRAALGLGAFAVVSFLAFVRQETLAKAPVLPLALLRHPPFALGIAGAVLLYTVTFMLSYLLPFELQHGLGLGATQAGLLMTAQPAAMAIAAPLSGVITDRTGPRAPSVAGMLAIAVGLLGLRGASGTLAIVVTLAIIGAGTGLFVAPNSSLVMGSAPRGRQGVASAMMATARNLGMTLGIAIAATLHRSLSFAEILLVTASLAAAGIALALARPVTTTSS